MARITDNSKIERLKESTMKLVVEKGYGGASAALISKDAKVASGYFYMHYASKYKMVNSILHEVYLEILDKVEELVKQGSSFEETVEKIVRHFIDIANNEPVKIKFLYVLTNDYSFVLDEEMRGNMYRIINRLCELGKKTGKLDTKLTEDDIYLILVITILQYINQFYKKNSNEKKLEEKEASHLLYLIDKLLK